MIRRYAHFRWTVIGLLAALTVWLLLVWGGFKLLDQPQVRAHLARKLASRLSQAVQQPVQVADVSVRVYPPLFAVRGLVVGSAEDPALEIREAEVGMGRVVLTEREILIHSVRLAGVRVNLEVPEFERRTARRSWVRVGVRHLEVEDVAIHNLVVPGGVAIRAEDVDLRWSGSTSAIIDAATFSARDFTLDVPGLKAPVRGSLSAWGRREPFGWRLGRAHGNGPGWRLDARGTWIGQRLDGAGRVAVDLAILDATVGIRADLTGEADIAWQGSVVERDFEVTAAVEVSAASVAGIGFSGLVAQAHVSSEGLEVSLREMGFAGGNIEGSYALEQFARPWRHRIAARGRGVDLAGLLEELGVSAAGLAGRTAISAELSWDGSDFPGAIGTGIADVRPMGGDVPARGRILVSLQADNSLHFESQELTLAGAPARWAGPLSMDGWVPDWTVQVDDIRLAVVSRLVHGWVGTEVFPPDLAGVATLDLLLRGPFPELTVNGSAALAPLMLGPVDADGAEVRLQISDGVLVLPEARIYVGPGRIRASGTIDLTGSQAMELAVEGRGVPIARMAQWAQVPAPLTGRVDLDGTLGGTVQAPLAQGDMRLRGISVAGIVLGEGAGTLRWVDDVVWLESLEVGPLAARVGLDLKRRQADVTATLEGLGLDAVSPPLARLVGGALTCTLEGSFPFDEPVGRLELASVGGARGTAVLDRNALRLELARPEAWRFSADLGRQNASFLGSATLDVFSWRSVVADLVGDELAVDGGLSMQAAVSIAPEKAVVLDGEIRELVVEVEGERATLREPAEFQVRGGEITVPGILMDSPHASLFVRASRGADGRLSGNVSGELSAALLGLVWPESRPSGRVELLGELLGSDDEPRFEGVARVVGGSLHLPGLPAPLTGISGVLEFVPEAIRLAGVSAQMAGGDARVSGRIALSPALELDLDILADRFRWPVAPGFTANVRGQARLAGPVGNLSLTGETVLLRTTYRRELNLQRLVLEGFLAPQRVTEVPTGELNINLNVAIPGTLEVDTSLARLAARGELRLVGDVPQVGVLGRLEVLPGGEFEFAGNRYELLRGTVTFTNPEVIEPFVDLLAGTTVQSWEVTFGLVGTLDRLTATFASNPPLPEMDIVALLALGRRADEAGELQAGVVATSFFTEQLTGVVARRARTLLDVDQLRVDPYVAGESGDPAARVTVVKQLSRDWTVTVSSNLAANREEIVNSRWRVSEGVFLEAAREADGTYSMEVKWHRRY